MVVSESFLEYRNGLYITDQTLQGIREYMKYFDIFICSRGGVCKISHEPPIFMESIYGSLGRDKVYLGSIEEAIKNSFPDVITALYAPQIDWLKDAGVPVVFGVEFTLKTRLQAYYSVQGISLLKKMRIWIGLLRQNRRAKQALKSVAGIEINGEGAYKEYGSLNKNSMYYYDHRISKEDMLNLKPSRNYKNGKSLCVAYSGRWTSIKGTDLFLEIARKTYAFDPSVKFTILGGGELEEQVKVYNLPNLEVKGFVKFDPDWKEYVSQHVDIMLLPHRQGDPSRTYFESLGMGIPVMGFANDTLSPLGDRNLAWVYKRFDTAEVADNIVRLNTDYAEVSVKSQNAIEFMKNRDYVSTMKSRAMHIVDSLKK